MKRTLSNPIGAHLRQNRMKWAEPHKFTQNSENIAGVGVKPRVGTPKIPAMPLWVVLWTRKGHHPSFFRANRFNLNALSDRDWV